MFEKLLSVAASNAKLAIAAVAGAALVAGGSAVAIQNVSSDSGTVTIADNASEQGQESRSDTATAKIQLPKPPKAPRPDKANNHGKCVSEAVAAAKAGLAAGAKQGPAVSVAARSCPKPGKGAATSAEAKKKAEAAREAAEAKRQAGQGRRP